MAPESAASPFAVAGPAADVAAFSVVDLDSEDLAGEASLWGVDAHNRTAHVGVAMLPAFRGRGLASDATRVLCDYAFVTLGLHRLQVETLVDNTPMIRAATTVGFRREGLLRRSSWAEGAFHDEVVLGLLSDEWRTPHRPS
jgi:RimJ/RimL family protein N-acetyltransferase